MTRFCTKEMQNPPEEITSVLWILAGFLQQKLTPFRSNNEPEHTSKNAR